MAIGRDRASKKVFPERRNNMCKSMEAQSHGSFWETASKPEWLEPREAVTGGRGQITHYLVLRAKSQGALLEFHSL